MVLTRNTACDFRTASVSLAALGLVSSQENLKSVAGMTDHELLDLGTGCLTLVLDM